MMSDLAEVADEQEVRIHFARPGDEIRSNKPKNGSWSSV
jgi:hypothetical protein